MADDDPFDLDFTHVAPAPATEPVPAPAPVRDDVGASVPQTASEPEPPSRYPRLFVPPALGEAAALFAAGRDVEATRRLDAALKGHEPLGEAAQRVWQALFELLQVQGRQQAFETLALAYAKRFELSPPAWSAPGTDDGHGYDGEGAEVVLTGRIDAGSAESLKQALRTAAAAPLVGIDLAAVTEVDDAGAGLLLRAATALRKAGKECILDHPDALADRLAAGLVAGARVHENQWLLLLQLLQQAGRQEAFDETAVNYAVTFERSPPAYEPPATPRAAPAKNIAPADTAPPLSLRGELSGPAQAQCDALARHDPVAGEVVTIDAAGLVRIDAEAAAGLKAALATLDAKAAGVRLTGLGQMVASLLATHGIDRLAELQTRPF